MKNDKKDRKHIDVNVCIVGIWVVYVVGVVVALLLDMFQEDKSAGLIASFRDKANVLDANSYITIAFFVVVLVAFALATILFVTGKKLSKSLNRNKNELKNLREQGKNTEEIINKICDGSISFGNRYLDEAFIEYAKDIKEMSYVSTGTYPDIENYINENLVDRVVWNHLLSQISGTMTGLGILGTFIGLSLGLSKFNLTGSSTDIIDEIQPLMNGIKVAFHTSIFGMVYSIGFNYFYRHAIETFRFEVEDYIDEFDQNVVRIAENSSDSAIVKYQEKIIEILDKQLKWAAVSYKLEEGNGAKLYDRIVAIENEVNSVEDKIVDFNQSMNSTVANVISEMIVPEIDRMSKAVESFAEKTLDDQSKELSKLIDAFTANMDKTLGDSFNQLREIITETNTWQKNSLSEMKKVLDTVNTSAMDLYSVNNTIESAAEQVRRYSDTVANLNESLVEKFEDYTKAVEDMQNGVNANLESLNIQVDLNNEIITKQTESLSKIIENENQTQMNMGKVIESLGVQSDKIVALSENTTESIKAANEALVAGIEKSTDGVIEHIKTETNSYMESLQTNMEDILDKLNEQVDWVHKLNADLSGDITSATKELSASANNLNKHLNDSITQTFMTFDNQLSIVVEHFASVLQHMEDTMDKTRMGYDSMSEDIREKFEKLQETLDQSLEYADKLHHDLSNKVAQMNENITRG